MKVGYKDFWVEVDLKYVCTRLSGIIGSFNEKLDRKYSRIFTVALIDDRFYQTGYIIDYGKIECSLEELDYVDFSHIYKTEGQLILHPTLKDLFVGEVADILVESTGQLTGFEPNTPELNQFDIVFKL